MQDLLVVNVDCRVIWQLGSKLHQQGVTILQLFKWDFAKPFPVEVVNV
jgi:predicted methyltransferase